MKDAITEDIYWRFRRAQALALKESGGDRSNEIHVTDLVYPCLRRAYYAKAFGYPMESRTMGILWSGVVGHEKMILKKTEDEFNELPVEYVFTTEDGEEVKVVGRIDDVIRVGDVWVIVDKKFVNTIPRDARDHHKTQVYFYAVMLKDNYGIEAKYGAILYIGMDREGKMNAVPHVFEINEIARREAEAILRERAEILWEAMKTKKPPPRVRTWLCDGYCPFLDRCALDD